MARILDEKFASLIKEIRKQTTEIEFALMYDAPDGEDVETINAIDLALKNALNQLDCAKVICENLE